MQWSISHGGKTFSPGRLIALSHDVVFGFCGIGTAVDIYANDVLVEVRTPREDAVVLLDADFIALEREPTADLRQQTELWQRMARMQAPVWQRANEKTRQWFARACANCPEPQAWVAILARLLRLARRHPKVAGDPLGDLMMHLIWPMPAKPRQNA